MHSYPVVFPLRSLRTPAPCAPPHTTPSPASHLELAEALDEALARGAALPLGVVQLEAQERLLQLTLLRPEPRPPLRLLRRSPAPAAVEALAAVLPLERRTALLGLRRRCPEALVTVAVEVKEAEATHRADALHVHRVVPDKVQDLLRRGGKGHAEHVPVNT